MDYSNSHGTKRLADPATAQNYPLPCQQKPIWHQRDDTIVANISLEHLDAASILVPSCSMKDPNLSYKITLIDSGERWELPRIPIQKDIPEKVHEDRRVSTHVDCFHIHKTLHAPILEYTVNMMEIPKTYLISCSWRPLDLNMQKITTPRSRAFCHEPRAISQHQDGGEIGSRICSPTSLCMVLESYGTNVDLLSISADCYDPITELYGIWPKAIHTAGKNGHLGSIETFIDWRKAIILLEAGYPIVTSIRFRSGELQGAPMKSSAGHLTVVHGISETEIRVYDPGASDKNGVNRTYSAMEFSQAWLSYRGVAYIVLP